MNLKNKVKNIRIILSLFVLFFIIGCGGELTSSLGEKGNLRYSIETDYQINSSLTDSTLATKMTHTINVDKAKTINSDNKLIVTHHVEPATNATITNLSETCFSNVCIEDFRVKISSPGNYKIVSSGNGQIIDYITLQFDEAAYIDILVKERIAYGDTFSLKSTPITATEGSQVVFIPIPTASDNITRLIGDGSYSVKCDDENLTVPAQSVSDANEDGGWLDSDGVWSWVDDGSFYLIEEGTVRFTLTEKESGYQGTVDIIINKL